MTRNIFTSLAVALLLAGSTAFALYSVSDTGDWPKDWPIELEGLRNQSKTYVGPTIESQHFVIPFTDHEQFETAWPHILKVKSEGAPIYLMRGPSFFLEKEQAGVIIHCPPNGHKTRQVPTTATESRSHWIFTNYIELSVDGKTVDLNRIELPANTPIFDQRFAKKNSR